MDVTFTHADGDYVIARARRDAVRFGCLRETDVALIAGDARTRLTLLLVRCGGGRFLAPANQVKHFTDIIERDGADYVRDVSLPAQS